MKIDISSLIGDLVEATVKSLKEDSDYEEFLGKKLVTRKYDDGKPDRKISIRGALQYAQDGQMDGNQSASYSQAIGLIDKEANKKNSGFDTEDLPDSVQDEIKKFKQQAKRRQDAEDKKSGEDTDAADREVSGDGATDALKDKGPDDDADTTDEPTDTKPKSLRKANITQDSINSIDGEAKEGGLQGTVKAPGNIGSKINEIEIGVATAMFSENPNISVDEVAKKLFDDVSKTPEGISNGEDKNKKACLAAAISAKRENTRVQEFMARENLDTKSTNVSHVWGAKESLENTVKSLEEAGVEEVNGIPLKNADPNYEDIILAGGAGENPTDTMIVMVDSSKKPAKAIILHTSNKMTTADIQSNSSPENNIRGMITEADRLKESGDLTDKEHKSIIKESNDTISEIASLQGEVENKVRQSFKNLEDKAKTGELADELEKASSGKWKQTVGRYTKAKGATNPNPEFRIEVSDPMTKEDRDKVADAYVREMEMLATTNDPPYKPTTYMTALMARVGQTDEEKEEINQLYRKQHDATNQMRERINKVKDGFGDRVMSETFMNRLHLNIAEGHAPGGIPPEYFELNMGINESEMKFDKDNKPYGKQGGKYYPLDIETGKVDSTAQPTKISQLSRGNTATVGNMETIASALGYKIPPPPKNIAEKIQVGSVESNKAGPGGKAFIFGINIKGERVVIGTQTIRPKDGPGTKAQDTIEFSKAFQTRMQLASLRGATQEALKESLRELQKFLKSVIV